MRARGAPRPSRRAADTYSPSRRSETEPAGAAAAAELLLHAETRPEDEDARRHRGDPNLRTSARGLDQRAARDPDDRRLGAPAEIVLDSRRQLRVDADRGGGG